MYILLKTVSLDYKLFRAETLSCNFVACAIHTYESIEELVIITMQQMGLMEVRKQMQILFCHMHLAKEKILFQSSYSGSLQTMGGKMVLHANKTCFLSH